MGSEPISVSSSANSFGEELSASDQRMNVHPVRVVTAILGISDPAWFAKHLSQLTRDSDVEIFTRRKLRLTLVTKPGLVLRKGLLLQTNVTHAATPYLDTANLHE